MALRPTLAAAAAAAQVPAHTAATQGPYDTSSWGLQAPPLYALSREHGQPRHLWVCIWPLSIAKNVRAVDALAMKGWYFSHPLSPQSLAPTALCSLASAHFLLKPTHSPRQRQVSHTAPHKLPATALYRAAVLPLCQVTSAGASGTHPPPKRSC